MHSTSYKAKRHIRAGASEKIPKFHFNEPIVSCQGKSSQKFTMDSHTTTKPGISGNSVGKYGITATTVSLPASAAASVALDTNQFARRYGDRKTTRVKRAMNLSVIAPTHSDCDRSSECIGQPSIRPDRRPRGIHYERFSHVALWTTRRRHRDRRIQQLQDSSRRSGRRPESGS